MPDGLTLFRLLAGSARSTFNAMTMSRVRSIVATTGVACTNHLPRCALLDRHVTPNVDVSHDEIVRPTKSVKTTTSAQPTNVVRSQAAIVCLMRSPTILRAQTVVHAEVASVRVPLQDHFSAGLSA
jgi:hypothetical protein